MDERMVSQDVLAMLLGRCQDLFYLNVNQPTQILYFGSKPPQIRLSWIGNNLSITVKRDSKIHQTLTNNIMKWFANLGTWLQYCRLFSNIYWRQNKGYKMFNEMLDALKESVFNMMVSIDEELIELHAIASRQSNDHPIVITLLYLYNRFHSWETLLESTCCLIQTACDDLSSELIEFMESFPSSIDTSSHSNLIYTTLHDWIVRGTFEELYHIMDIGHTLEWQSSSSTWLENPSSQIKIKSIESNSFYQLSKHFFCKLYHNMLTCWHQNPNDLLSNDSPSSSIGLDTLHQQLVLILSQSQRLVGNFKMKSFAKLFSRLIQMEGNHICPEFMTSCWQWFGDCHRNLKMLHGISETFNHSDHADGMKMRFCQSRLQSVIQAVTSDIHTAIIPSLRRGLPSPINPSPEDSYTAYLPSFALSYWRCQSSLAVFLNYGVLIKLVGLDPSLSCRLGDIPDDPAPEENARNPVSVQDVPLTASSKPDRLGQKWISNLVLMPNTALESFVAAETVSHHHISTPELAPAMINGHQVAYLKASWKSMDWILHNGITPLYEAMKEIEVMTVSLVEQSYHLFHHIQWIKDTLWIGQSHHFDAIRRFCSYLGSLGLNETQVMRSHEDWKQVNELHSMSHTITQSMRDGLWNPSNVLQRGKLSDGFLHFEVKIAVDSMPTLLKGFKGTSQDMIQESWLLDITQHFHGVIDWKWPINQIINHSMMEKINQIGTFILTITSIKWLLEFYWKFILSNGKLMEISKKIKQIKRQDILKSKQCCHYSMNCWIRYIQNLNNFYKMEIHEGIWKQFVSSYRVAVTVSLPQVYYTIHEMIGQVKGVIDLIHEPLIGIVKELMIAIQKLRNSLQFENQMNQLHSSSDQDDNLLIIFYYEVETQFLKIEHQLDQLRRRLKGEVEGMMDGVRRTQVDNRLIASKLLDCLT